MGFTVPGTKVTVSASDLIVPGSSAAYEAAKPQLAKAYSTVVTPLQAATKAGLAKISSGTDIANLRKLIVPDPNGYIPSPKEWADRYGMDWKVPAPPKIIKSAADVTLLKKIVEPDPSGYIPSPKEWADRYGLDWKVPEVKAPTVKDATAGVKAANKSIAESNAKIAGIKAAEEQARLAKKAIASTAPAASSIANAVTSNVGKILTAPITTQIDAAKAAADASAPTASKIANAVTSGVGSILSPVASATRDVEKSVSNITPAQVAVAAAAPGLAIPAVTGMIPGVPGIPGVPSIPGITGLPTIPGITGLPGVPGLPGAASGSGGGSGGSGGMPGIPDMEKPTATPFKALVDENGNFMPGSNFQVKASLLDPKALAANTQALDAYRSRAMSGEDNPWFKLQQQKLAQDQIAQGDILGQQALSQGATTRSQLAMRGGLGGGAAERIASGVGRDLTANRQMLARQGMGDRLSLGIANEQQNMQMLGQVPGMDLNLAKYNADLAKYNADALTGQDRSNVGTVLQDIAAKRAYDANTYNQQMQAWGANKTAQAIAASGGKPGATNPLGIPGMPQIPGFAEVPGLPKIPGSANTTFGSFPTFTFGS